MHLVCENACVCHTWRMVSTGLGVIGRYPIGPTWEVALYKSEKETLMCCSLLSAWVTVVLKCIQVIYYHIGINPWAGQTPWWRVLERRSSKTILKSTLFFVLQVSLQKSSLGFSSMDLSCCWICSYHLQNSVGMRGFKALVCGITV